MRSLTNRILLPIFRSRAVCYHWKKWAKFLSPSIYLTQQRPSRTLIYLFIHNSKNFMEQISFQILFLFLRLFRSLIETTYGILFFLEYYLRNAEAWRGVRNIVIDVETTFTFRRCRLQSSHSYLNKDFTNIEVKYAIIPNLRMGRFAAGNYQTFVILSSL